MEHGKTEPERQALYILELIDALRGAQWNNLSALQAKSMAALLDDLEDSYRFAMAPWAEHRTTAGELMQEDFYRWHEYMFTPDVYEEAVWRFNELLTTSRFSVEDESQVFDLQQVNSPNEKITIRHVVSLAVLACIQFALEELESLELLDQQKDIENLDQKMEQAYGLKKQAALWLSHLATLDLSKRDAEYERETEQEERKKQPRKAAEKPRKDSTRELTAEVVAAFYNERKGQKLETVRNELREKFKDGDKYTVSESTISRIYKKAKEKNLVS